MGNHLNGTAWYEPYAKDYYWKGPEIGKETNKEFKTSINLKEGNILY